MKKIVLDTNILIDWRRGRLSLLEKLFKQMFDNSCQLFIPTAVTMELWTGDEMNDPDLEKLIYNLLSPVNKIELSDPISKTAGILLRHKLVHHSIDSIVAASTLEIDGFWATTNLKHFKNVPNLKIFEQK